MGGVNIRRAELIDVEQIAPLFDLYRQFYRMPADLTLAVSYIGERLKYGESAIFLAERNGQVPIGFCQVYFGFCSVMAGRICILNDLFVAAGDRGSGAGRALLAEAERFASGWGALRISLQTAHDNTSAQALYESAGWVRSEGFYPYVKRFSA